MVALLTAESVDPAALPAVAGQFALQLGVGTAIGVAGGRGLLWFIRRVGLPAEGLYPLRTLASVFVIYGVATLAHGSGFLAVFIAGILLGDERAPFKREIERFHSALASLAEIVAFVVLGLTVDLDELLLPQVWVPGLVLGAVVAFVIRPLLVGLCLIPVRLHRREKAFILFAGLKGAVPILLASYLLAANIPQGARLYGIVVVVVVFSVLVQGSLVPTAARALRLPMRTVQPKPWSLGIRLRAEPEGLHRFTIAPGSPADGRTVEDLADLPVDVWVSFVVRDHQLLTVRGDTALRAGDDVLVLADDDLRERLIATFEHEETPHPPPTPGSPPATP
jgi:cell volume regulation protein A